MSLQLFVRRAWNVDVLARLLVMTASVMLTFAAAAPHAARAEDVKWSNAAWTEGQPHEPKEIGISGIALAEDDGDVSHFVVVHDGKKKDWARLSVLAVKKDHTIKRFKEITVDNWPDEKRPDDFEAVAALPENDGPSVHFLALTSDGTAYMLAIDVKNARGIVEWKAELPGHQANPPDSDQFEGFCFAPGLNVGTGRVACAWARRGLNANPASLRWGVLDVLAHKFTESGAEEVRVSFPKQHVRHISDVRVGTTGKVIVSAASDPDIDDGPFGSAVYAIGTLELDGQTPTFKRSADEELMRSPIGNDGKKTEAIELTKGGFVLGTDDENKGAAIGFLGH